MSERTYYHVAGEGYEAGDDLLCYDEIEALGEAPVWKYDGEPVDTDVICLFETLGEATEYHETYGGTMLLVTLPDEIRTIRNDEGFVCVFRRISREYVSEVTA